MRVIVLISMLRISTEASVSRTDWSKGCICYNVCLEGSPQLFSGLIRSEILILLALGYVIVRITAATISLAQSALRVHTLRRCR